MKGVKEENKMVEGGEMQKVFIPNVKVEIKKVENLRPEIREKWNLGDNGLVFRIMTQNSPYEFRYEKIEGSFFDSVTKSLKNTDLSEFIKRARKK